MQFDGSSNQQVFSSFRQRTKTIFQLLPPLIQLLTACGLGEFSVEVQPLHTVHDVAAVEIGRRVKLYLGFRIGDGDRFSLKHAAKFILLQLSDRVVQNSCVEFESKFIDESALLGTEDISGTPYIEIPHGDVETRSQI